MEEIKEGRQDIETRFLNELEVRFRKLSEGIDTEITEALVQAIQKRTTDSADILTAFPSPQAQLKKAAAKNGGEE